MIGRWLLAVVGLLQLLVGARVALRLARDARGARVVAASATTPVAGAVTVVVPVLNEQDRLGPCLEGLIAQGPEVDRIVVADGGSVDGTAALARGYAARDSRVRVVAAGAAPPDWNGKAWGLAVGLRQAGDAAWVLTIDADVRPAPALARSLLAHADRHQLSVLSVATTQELAGPSVGLVHPALLATLIYRFGIPGHARHRVDQVMANGQCFLARRTALDEVGGFAAVRESVCEDVTLARALARAGYAVGFYEADDLVRCAMYRGGWEAWRNWTRSLPLRDRYLPLRSLVGLAEVTLAQALPAPLLLVLLRLAVARWLVVINLVLVAMRLGILIGAARAYRRRPWTYWLSPVCDLPAVAQLWISALRRRHSWRGRPISRGG